MKKTTLLLAGIALIAFSLTSCKGDYTCECVYTWSDGTTTDYSYDFNDMKQADAEEACDSYSIYDGYDCSLY